MDMNNPTATHTEDSSPSMIASKNSNSNPTVQPKSSIPKEKYVLGESGCYFIPNDYLLGKLSDAKVSSMFRNENTTIEPTDNKGRSLKVMFTANDEVKLLGFISAGDPTMSLNESHIEQITKVTKEQKIVKAISVDELVNMF